MHLTAKIDFSDPHGGPDATRLRHAFGTPQHILTATTWSEVPAVLDGVQAAAEKGAWCIGYLRYEAAGAFDIALRTHPADGPLAWFAVYGQALPWPEDHPTIPPAPTLHWSAPAQRPVFDAALHQIQQAIANGEYYQVNYTAQMVAAIDGMAHGAAPALFAALQRAQPGGYAAYIDTGHEQVLSVSPELFFDWHSQPHGGEILARPMKGTAPRGHTPEQDTAQATALRNSPKERAENVMIVDLLRNDLSRLATPGSVQVPRLFHTQALPAVWQMTSDVQAHTRAGTSLAQVFGALFPCGSVTGAPKVRAMQAIAALETGPRGIYCGALGVVRPLGDGSIHATFNVPIRTVVLQGNQARCGIGSGITAGSQASAEWNEWRHKRAFVEQASMSFDLLETLALENGQWRHGTDHLARLHRAAQHFSYPWDAPRIHQCLADLAQAQPQGNWRVRLLLDSSGQPSAQAFTLEASPPQVRLQLATQPLAEAHSPFVHHKTTHRAHYDAFTPTLAGIYDTVLYNEEGEITECTRGNVAMLLDGQWVTPALHCGLLPGVGRAVALRNGRLREAVVRLEDRPRIQAWAFLNSLRGWIAAELI
ncbi:MULTISPECIES: chorismate-binding protein [Giesbergeria]|uniref:Chorismate-binding protein n=1 Tax=Giesbergeria sinuosa TaxID=80883 RepID=A0ABV9QEJ5_9BURK